MNITASSRQQQGTSASRRLRREAKVPGILYGNNEPASMIALDHNELYYSLQKEKFHSSILTMSLDGAEQLVVLRAFQMHPYKNQVLHADFQRIDPNSNVTMRVPLHFFGGENSPAVKISKGFISHLVSFVEVTCLPKYLPEHIDVDESGMTRRHRDGDRRRSRRSRRCRRGCRSGCCRRCRSRSCSRRKQVISFDGARPARALCGSQPQGSSGSSFYLLSLFF